MHKHTPPPPPTPMHLKVRAVDPLSPLLCLLPARPMAIQLFCQSHLLHIHRHTSLLLFSTQNLTARRISEKRRNITTAIEVQLPKNTTVD